jgi:hypothetical protein
LAQTGAEARNANLEKEFISEPEIDLFADNDITDVLIYPNPSNGGI